MTRHIAVDMGHAWAVAYDSGHGAPLAVCECPSEESARREADRMNREAAMMQRASMAAAIRQATQDARRRPVRWFEPDAFA